MKHIKFFLTLSLFLILSPKSRGQNTPYNLVSDYMKYWKVRGRLIGDENNRDQYNGFMVVGGETGMSIPAEYRIPNKPNSYASYSTYDSVTGDYFRNGNDCYSQNTGPNWTIDPRDGRKKSGFLNWGDATIGIGHYLIALSYEWQLLNRTGDNSRWRTEREIYYALKALQRLDVWGESTIPQYNTSSPNWNGFFARDDVPGNFALNRVLTAKPVTSI